MTQICVKCGLDWSVSNYALIPRSGYKCPYCRLAEEREREKHGKVDHNRPQRVGCRG